MITGLFHIKPAIPHEAVIILNFSDVFSFAEINIHCSDILCIILPGISFGAIFLKVFIAKIKSPFKFLFYINFIER